MIDTHMHFITGGSGLASVQLRDAATPEEFVEHIAAFAATLPPEGGRVAWSAERDRKP